jgi:hypothetical protein
MRTHVLVATAALILAALTAGCERSTPGTVAMTTEPGPPINSPTRAPSLPSMPSIPGLPDIHIPNLPNIPIPGINPNVPEVPPPANATTMACKEFSGLDDATKLAVVRAILKQQNRSSQENEMFGIIMADTMCQLMPEAEVNEVVMGPPMR